MNESLAETLRAKRKEKGLSQQQLANLIFVDRSTVASWETGRRTPDIEQISRIAECLRLDLSALLQSVGKADRKIHVILLDDEKIILNGTLPTLREAIPGAEITGFLNPVEALEFARSHPVSIAFLDIRLGTSSGLDICRDLLKIRPTTNVIFLTAYMDYAFSAWETGASGFLLKPVSVEDVKNQLARLRYPIGGLNT